MTRPQDKAALMLLGIAVIGWYAGARAAVEALGAARRSPGRRAIAYCLPVALVAILAVVFGHPEIAVGAIFASSVAAMTLVLGIITLSARHTHPTQPRKLWSFVLPTALLAMLIGLSGGIRWIHAGILLLEGLALLSLWNDMPMAQVARDSADGPGESTSADLAAPTPPNPWRGALLAFSILAAGVAGWLAVTAAVDLSNNLNLTGGGLVTALMLGPGLVLAMIGSGSAAAHEGRYDNVVATHVGFVLLNLCAVLPLTTALWLTRPYWYPPRESVAAAASAAQMSPTSRASTAPATTSAATTAPADLSAPELPQALPYPMAVWRVDTVLLVAVGLLLLPVALGRWSVGKAEGFAMLFTYLMYMILTAAMARPM